jgi:predicted 3-demethylubiquinone-9 3-methyltransferase (glyoxalase superfamily)
MKAKITPFLWFDGQAEQAARFYAGIFPNSRIVSLSRYGEAGPGPSGSVMSVVFEIEGQQFAALNGGPQFKFSPATSFFIECQTQQEVDEYWDKLGAGGQIHQCGWLTDRFGVTWQVVPAVLETLLRDPDPKKSQSVMKAMMKMVKLDVAGLQRAHERG